MSDVRIGIIGAGAIVQVAHLPVLRKLKDVQVVALCDSDRLKARAIADRYGIKDAFSDIEEVLGYEELDALLICTPTHLHEAHVLAALGAGVHILVERPLAMSGASVQRILRAAAKSERVLMVGMNHRYRPDVQIVRSFVQSGELGDVDSVRGSWHVFRPSRSQLGWRLRRDQAGGGALFDLGLTILDLGLWLAGQTRPRRVSASADRAASEGKSVEQSGSAFVVCDTGTSVFLDVTWRHFGEGERFGVGLRASKGSASINPLTVFKELQGIAVDVSPTGSGSRENPFTASYRAEWAHFLAAIRGEARAPSLEEQVILHSTLDAIYQSVKEGREIDL